MAALSNTAPLIGRRGEISRRPLTNTLLHTFLPPSPPPLLLIQMASLYRRQTDIITWRLCSHRKAYSGAGIIGTVHRLLDLSPHLCSSWAARENGGRPAPPGRASFPTARRKDSGQAEARPGEGRWVT